MTRWLIGLLVLAVAGTGKSLTVFPDGMRRDHMRAPQAPDMVESGVNGDPTRSAGYRHKPKKSGARGANQGTELTAPSTNGS